MIRTLKAWLSVAALSLMAACGGGGGSAGDPVLGGGGTGSAGTVKASDLVLVLSAPTLANSGTETVVATATALDGNRNTIPGVPVTISVDSNATASTSGAVTDTEGSITATVGIGADRSARVITVTARSGSLTQTASLQVTNSGVSGGIAAADLVLALSSNTIKTDGSETVTVTATALDAKRNTMSGVPIQVTVDSGIFTPSGATTASNGTVSGVLSMDTNTTPRTITVTATSGAISRTVTVSASAASTASGPAATDLTLVLSGATLDNGGTNTLTATVTAVDSNRNALANVPVTFAVDASAVVAPRARLTSPTGVVLADVGIGSDRSNRVVTVTATAGSLTRTVSFRVIGAKLSATFAPLVDAGSTGNTVLYALLDTNSNPMPNQTIAVTAPGQPTATGTTDVNGKYAYTYTAPAVAGSFVVTAAAAGDTRTETVQVQTPGSTTISPAPEAPLSASVTPTPSVISVNVAGSTSNQVEVRALFLGANNKPVPRMRVRFDLDGNATNSDGAVAWLGGNYAYSDANGVARATFTPGQLSSPTNGVTIRACYGVGDFDFSAATAGNNCPAAAPATRATLTVTSEALAVSIRTNELIEEGDAKLTYIKKFVVMVVDAAGQAKADVQITPSIDLPSYHKGYWTWNGTTWIQSLTLFPAPYLPSVPSSRTTSNENYVWNAATRTWNQSGTTTTPSCPNEDFNRNGVLETGEDLNGNGSLDPRKSDVAIKMVGSSRTDASGLAIVQIEYGKDLASWVDYVITVTAAGISGTEARAKYIGTQYGVGALPYPAAVTKTETPSPAFRVSPYGLGSTCVNTN